jgi:hypothetical protein
MQSLVTQWLEVLRRVLAFLAVTEVKPELGIIAKHVEELKGVIEQLIAEMVSQERSDRAYRSSASTARMQARRLREVFLRPVVGYGKKLFKDEPTLFRMLTMPGGRGYQRLITAAYAVADVAAERKDAFVAAGFREDFADQVRKATALLAETIDARGSHLGHRSGATSGMSQELSKGRELVRLLDTLVRPWLAEHAPEKVAEWKTLTRFARATPVADVVAAGATQTSTPGSSEGHAA